MQKVLKLIFLLVVCFVFSCQQANKTAYQCPMKCEGDKTYIKQNKCPICNMDLQISEEKELTDNQEITENSIFNLTSDWHTQDNKKIKLKYLKGNILVFVMIYTHCQAACPRLVADMRDIATQVANPTIKYVLISIDPEKDTPERLKTFAIENNIDNNQWIFLRGEMEDVREFSNVLSVKYKKISPIDFSHSNIISVFNKQGELYYQKEGFSADNNSIIKKINALIKEDNK